jgi:hypothetical protein
MVAVAGHGLFLLNLNVPMGAVTEVSQCKVTIHAKHSITPWVAQFFEVAIQVLTPRAGTLAPIFGPITGDVVKAEKLHVSFLAADADRSAIGIERL